MGEQRGCPHKDISKSHVKDYYSRTIHCIGCNKNVLVQRRECLICGRTFTIQPEGLAPYQRFSGEVYRIATALKHPLAATLRSGLYLFREILRVAVNSHATIWNWMKTAGERAKAFLATGCKGKGSGIVCVDEIYTKAEGLRTYILVCSTAEGKLQDMQAVEEKDIETIKRFVQKQWMRGAKILVSDGNPVYIKITDELEMKHQLCIFHIDEDIAKIASDFNKALEKKAAIVAKNKDKRPCSEINRELEEITKKQKDIKWMRRQINALLNAETIWDVYEQMEIVIENSAQFPMFNGFYELLAKHPERIFLHLFEGNPKTNNMAEQIGRFFKPFYKRMKTFHAYGKEQQHLDLFMMWFNNHEYMQGKNKGSSPNELCGQKREEWMDLVSVY